MKVNNLRSLAGIIIAVVTGLLPAIQVRADSGAEHQVAQAWPVKLGTSGGNINDRSSLYCCSGTLGAVVQGSTGILYILSNNHVLARGNQGRLGEDVNQPGMIDQYCGQSGAVADLSKFVTIQFWGKGKKPINYVDAAIAAIRPGAVSTDGAILDVGVVSTETLGDTLGLAVCKSGRTTGFTAGNITMVNVTVNVGYSKNCGGQATLTATYADQMVIGAPAGSPVFSAGGDSGSLIVEVPPDATTPPRAVGLLFAGNSTQTIANPINRVLSGLGVTMAGVAPTVSGTGVIQAAMLDAAKAVNGRHSARLLAAAGVHGHGIGLSKAGTAVIRVLVTKDQAEQARAQIPEQLEGTPVEIIVTEPFVAY